MDSKSTQKIVDQVKAHSGEQTILSYSAGKDALGAYLAIRDSFQDIVPYYLHLVPNLSFVDEYLDYAERRIFGRKIIRLPHPGFVRQLQNLVYQPPMQVGVVMAFTDQLDYKYDYEAVRKFVCHMEGLDPQKAMVASGVRAADSPLRRVAMQKSGGITWSKHQYYPVWDWYKDELLEAIAKSGFKLPPDYWLFGRTYDGVDPRFVIPIRDNYPEDYKRILEWFPMVEMRVWYLEKRGQP